MATCKHCGDVIEDAMVSVFDGQYWFCTIYCRSNWQIKRGRELATARGDARGSKVTR